MQTVYVGDEMETAVLAPSDSQYAEALQFQETLIASQSQISMDDRVSIESASLSIPIPHKTLGFDPEPKPPAVQESGETSQRFCEICAERKEPDEMLSILSCTHSVCFDCISKHVSVKARDGTAAASAVTCPGLGCPETLELAACRGTVPADVLSRWEAALCESLIAESLKFYCPYRDCSALLVNDVEGGVIRESECPICRRLFCAQCYVAWHSGFDCEEFQRLSENERGREDLMVIELARGESWNRCPRCKFFVEKTEGCSHITCRSVPYLASPFTSKYSFSSFWTKSIFYYDFLRN